MSLAYVLSRANSGFSAPLVTVEVHITGGLPKFTIVGLAETAVKESKERVRSALLNSNFAFPYKRITVNLAPADLPKEGGRFDLAIAIGILVASKQISNQGLQDYEFLGELGLAGQLLAVPGIMIAGFATQKDHKSLICSESNRLDIALLHDLKAYPAQHLLAVIAHLNKSNGLTPASPIPFNYIDTSDQIDHIKGQIASKRALEIAAAGKHHTLLFGSPGSGKTLIAQCLLSLLPLLSEIEFLEVVALHSLASPLTPINFTLQRPLRTPHHTASSVGLVGGGKVPKPGEISLAHHGVLFLDELPEFSRAALQTLREPLDNHKIIISRANSQVEFPANFQLIAAMNPCPCGYLNDKEKLCSCSEEQIRRYIQKVSGPLLDRIDIRLAVTRVSIETLLTPTPQPFESGIVIRKRIIQAQNLQYARQGKLNTSLTAQEIDRYCKIPPTLHEFFLTVLQKLTISGRGIHRVLKIARTIADLNNQETLNQTDLIEALQLSRDIFTK
jgi:magnesium chelatase family protein